MPKTSTDDTAAASHRLLVLAALGEPWGSAILAAAEVAGYVVEQAASLPELLRSLPPPAATDASWSDLSDIEERPPPAAVLVVGRRLRRAPREQRRRLIERIDRLALPLVILAEASDGHPFEELQELSAGAVTVVEAPPSERVLATVLQGLRGERRRRLRIRRLQDRLEKLRDAGQREERLLARVGHELRNPLGAITTTLTLLRELNEDPSADRYFQIIDRQVTLLHTAVDGLLDMTDVGRTPLAGDLEAPRQDGGGEAARHRPWHSTHGDGSLAGDGDGGRATRRGDDDAAATAEGNGDGRPSAHLHGPVLVVEDDPDGRAALRDLLQLWGYDVVTAAAGESGVARAAENRPAIALVDIDLPGINGYEVARRLRQRFPEAPPLLVAMTGFGQPEDRDRALEAGFDLHLVKPVRPSRLEELLRHPERAAGGGSPAEDASISP